jgi:DNA-directed RNA polymerase specialized sigma24 family protein
MRANPKRAPMSRRQQWAILQMRREGLKPEIIADAVGCHRATVYRVLARRRQQESAL